MSYFVLRNSLCELVTPAPLGLFENTIFYISMLFPYEIALDNLLELYPVLSEAYQAKSFYYTFSITKTLPSSKTCAVMNILVILAIQMSVMRYLETLFS